MCLRNEEEQNDRDSVSKGEGDRNKILGSQCWNMQTRDGFGCHSKCDDKPLEGLQKSDMI